MVNSCALWVYQSVSVRGMCYVMRPKRGGGGVGGGVGVLENQSRFPAVNARSENHFKTDTVQSYRGDKWKHDNAALKPTGTSKRASLLINLNGRNV